MSDPEIPRLYLDSAADIAQLAPYLIGFTPEESLVIVVMEDSQVQVTARADLADMLPPGAAEDLLDRIWARFPNTDAFLIAYTHDTDAGWALLDRCADHLPDGVLRQNMLVNQDTWHLPDGTHGRLDPSGRVSAEAAAHGMKLLSDRAELEARFASAPDSPKLDTAIRAALDEQPRYRTLTALLDHAHDLLHRNLVSRAPFAARTPSKPVSVADAVQLTQLVQNQHARDFVLASITKATAPRHLALWSEVLNRIPSRFAEVPAAIAGIAAWVSGDGAAANIALARSQATTTGPRPSGPADMLDAILDQVLPPSAWPSVRGRILELADQHVHHALTSPIRTVRTQPAREASTLTTAPHAGRPSPSTGPTL